MDNVSAILDIQKRLIAMVDNPPYRFKKTSRQAAEAYQRKLKIFEGYSEHEVAEAEQKHKTRFPKDFRDYLLIMGKRQGDLFRGSDVAGIDDFEKYFSDALELIEEAKTDFLLPDNAVVFLFHQGYTFLYLIADGGISSQIFQYVDVEGHRKPTKVADSFLAMVDSEVQAMESLHSEQHLHGGYYHILQGNGRKMEFPARSSGIRPLDGPDEFI
jgi:hypothetical protein